MIYFLAHIINCSTMIDSTKQTVTESRKRSSKLRYFDYCNGTMHMEWVEI